MDGQPNNTGTGAGATETALTQQHALNARLGVEANVIALELIDQAAMGVACDSVRREKGIKAALGIVKPFAFASENPLHACVRAVALARLARVPACVTAVLVDVDANEVFDAAVAFKVVELRFDAQRGRECGRRFKAGGLEAATDVVALECSPEHRLSRVAHLMALACIALGHTAVFGKGAGA